MVADLGSGKMNAFFQSLGSLLEANDFRKIHVNGYVIASARRLRRILGMPSGPQLVDFLALFNVLYTDHSSNNTEINLLVEVS